MIARRLKLLYIDTGSMYRAVALAVIEANIDPTDHEAIASLAQGLQIDLEGDPDSLKVKIRDRDVTEAIRSERVTEVSSIISTIPGVRRAMVDRQREMGKVGAVLNGRDITTVVFPEARFKFFLTASPEERAGRRFREDQARNKTVTFEETLAEINERDARDMTRTESPLRIAGDALVVDSTGKSIEQVFTEIMEIISSGQGHQAGGNLNEAS